LILAGSTLGPSIQRTGTGTAIHRFQNETFEKLPTEIIALILCIEAVSLAAPARHVREPESEMMAYSPLKLGAVCRHWRKIVWSTPILWTYISIPVFKCLQPGRIILLQDWIAHSKSLPLTIYMYDGPRSSLICGPLFQVLFQSSHRWRYVKMDLPYTLLFSILQSVRDLSLLRALWIYRGEVYGSVLSDEIEKRFQPSIVWAGSKPKPEILRIDDYLSQRININWAGLIHVEAHTWTALECIRLLRCMPLLETLKVLFIQPRAPTDIDPAILLGDGPFIHDNLRTLEYLANPNRVDLFSSVEFPGLLSFSFDIYPNILLLPDNQLVMQKFFERTGSNLQSLNLNRSGFSMESILGILRAANSLISVDVHLGITGDEQSDSVLASLIQLLSVTISNDTICQSTAAQGKLLPCLQKLRYQIQKNPFFFQQWDLVIDLFGPPENLTQPDRRPLWDFEMYSRGSYSSTLCLDDIPEVIQPQFAALQSAGVKLKFPSSSSSTSQDVPDENESEFGMHLPLT